MNVIIGWILLVIVMSTFITFVLGYDLDLKDKIMCIVGTDAFVILLAVGVYLEGAIMEVIMQCFLIAIAIVIFAAFITFIFFRR
jgi:hypothetical protein